jgi:CRP/FNR family transcriptional regulator, cyclic AMP receptor protein
VRLSVLSLADMDDIDLLARSDLFSAFDQETLGKLVAAARPVECERNFVVFEEEGEANEMFVVRSGRVAVGRRSIDGRESLVALMEEGDLFGEMSLFDEGTRSASARALEHSQILGIPYGVVREALDARPELLWQVVRLLAERLRYTDSALADAVFLDVTGRTAKRLLELAGDADDFQLPITQEELAGLVGASRERVNKSIAAFIRLGWIEQLDRRYRIVARDRLAQRAR